MGSAAVRASISPRIDTNLSRSCANFPVSIGGYFPSDECSAQWDAIASRQPDKEEHMALATLLVVAVVAVVLIVALRDGRPR